MSCGGCHGCHFDRRLLSACLSHLSFLSFRMVPRAPVARTVTLDALAAQVALAVTASRAGTPAMASVACLDLRVCPGDLVCKALRATLV